METPVTRCITSLASEPTIRDISWAPMESLTVGAVFRSTRRAASEAWSASATTVTSPRLTPPSGFRATSWNADPPTATFTPRMTWGM